MIAEENIVTFIIIIIMSSTRGQKSPGVGDKHPRHRLSDTTSDTTSAVRAFNMQDASIHTNSNVTDVPDSNSQIDYKAQIDNIYGGWGNKKVIERMEDTIKNECSGPIRPAAKKYLLGLLTCEDEDLLTTFDVRQKELGDAINELRKVAVVKKRTKKKKGSGKKGKKKSVSSSKSTHWQANLGEALNILTEALLLANYAPSSDCDIQDGKYCRQDRKNSCMIKFCRVSVCMYILLLLIGTSDY